MGEINGITFSNQAVTPKDDGQLRSHIMQDGILSGCAMSYSAATFSLGAGYLIAAGRLMRVPATVYLAVDQATSGFARVLLTIDLTATATKDEFDQAQLSVEYSSTQTGFASLVQGDVNGSDTKYQTVLAVLPLGTGGITGIASKISEALLRSGLAMDATLTSSGWNSSSLTYTLTVPGITADRAKTHAIVDARTRAAKALWTDSDVMCESQGDGYLVFSCESVPSGNIAISILVIGSN